MFDWILSILASVSYGTAVSSAGLASSNGMHQMKEPENLQEEAKQAKERN